MRHVCACVHVCVCATSQVAAAIESSIVSGFSPNKNACGHVCACVLCDFASAHVCACVHVCVVRLRKLLLLLNQYRTDDFE